MPAPHHLIPTGKAVRASLVAALLAGTAFGGYAAGEAIVAPARAATPAPVAANVETHVPDFVNLITSVKPAVVSITNRLKPQQTAMQSPFNGQSPFKHFPFPFPFPFGHTHPHPVEALGSGYIISASGIIVTNNHVVKNEKTLTVILDDGTKLPARIIGTDPRTDIAVLKVNAGHPLPYVQFGDSSKAKPGEWVIAMGNPFGLGGTATAGIVSALGRNIGDGPYDQFIQVDAPINEGNSGGPLFDQQGKVIGMDTAIISPSGGSVGIGFAIPSDTIKAIVDTLEKSGHVTRGYLGVEAQPITPSMQQALNLPSQSGALLAAIEPGTPAQKAGLQPGDVITEVNGSKINDPRNLAIDIAGMKPGATAHLKVIENGHTKDVAVSLSTLPEHLATNNHHEQGAEHEQLGLALEPVTPEARAQLNLPAGTEGAVIAAVAPNSPAADSGLQAGDVIIGVGQQPVTSVSGASKAIHTAENRDHAVALRVIHHGQTVFVAINLATSGNKAG
ncbi:MAG: Do family serine endopeptidase [Acetobacteraceae bacterium]